MKKSDFNFLHDQNLLCGDEKYQNEIGGQSFDETRKQPQEWAAEIGVRIIDPDGWRREGADFTIPCTQAEFEARIIFCTCVEIKRNYK